VVQFGQAQVLAEHKEVLKMSMSIQLANMFSSMEQTLIQVQTWHGTLKVNLVVHHAIPTKS
jgi:hypothetical protein